MAPRALRDNMPEPPISHGQPRFGPSRNAKSAVPMTINNLIESVGLSAEELRRYLVAEIDEFLAASDPAAMEEEFGDALFALACMAWAHSGQHYRLGLDAAEAKLRQRLRDHAHPHPPPPQIRRRAHCRDGDRRRALRPGPVRRPVAPVRPAPQRNRRRGIAAHRRALRPARQR